MGARVAGHAGIPVDQCRSLEAGRESDTQHHPLLVPDRKNVTQFPIARIADIERSPLKLREVDLKPKEKGAIVTVAVPAWIRVELPASAALTPLEPVVALVTDDAVIPLMTIDLIPDTPTDAMSES